MKPKFKKGTPTPFLFRKGKEALEMDDRELRVKLLEISGSAERAKQMEDYVKTGTVPPLNIPLPKTVPFSGSGTGVGAYDRVKSFTGTAEEAKEYFGPSSGAQQSPPAPIPQREEDDKAGDMW